MKKIIFSIILVLLLTGCSNITKGYLEKTCENTIYGDIDTYKKYKISFKENKISKIILKEIYTFNKIELKEAVVIGLNDLKNNNIKGLEIKSLENKNSYEIEYIFNYNEIDSNILKKYNLYEKYNDQKKYLENIGYTCK